MTTTDGPSHPTSPRPPGPTRVLVADDSQAAQRELVELLRGAPDVQVIGCAGDGEEALRLALQERPDCVCLDLDMPRMDGFTFLRLLMARQPAPVIVVSAHARKADVFKALELGALDFVAKADARDGRDLGVVRDELLSKVATVRALAAPIARAGCAAGEPEARDAAGAAPLRRAGRLTRVAVVGASTGGPAALVRLLAALPPEVRLGVAVAQHMPENFTRGFALRLARTTGFDVREAEEGDELVDGRVLVAPGGRHLRLVSAGGPFSPVLASLAPPDPRDGPRYCPSVDELFASAATAMGGRVCAVVLTGMGNDGRRGVERVKEAGGCAFAESEASAVVFGMPREAAATGAVDEVLPLEDIGARLRRFAEAP